MSENDQNKQLTLCQLEDVEGQDQKHTVSYKIYKLIKWG